MDVVVQSFGKTHQNIVVKNREKTENESERKAMDVTRRGEEVGRWWDRLFAHLATIPPTRFAGFTLD